MIWRFLRWLFLPPRPPEPHQCEKHGHRYEQRFDEMIDPRLDRHLIKAMMSSPYQRPEIGRVKVRIYVKDICVHCGDVIERLEGLNAMEVVAYAAKRIGSKVS